MRSAAAVLCAVPLGIAIGIAGHGIDRVHGGLTWAAALGVPWLALAFVLGALARERVAAVLAGSSTLVLGTVAWYLVHFAQGSPPSAWVVVCLGWASAAAAAGGTFALAGAAWRTSDGEGRAALLATAALAGALVGEAVLLAREWPERAARAVLAAELAVGLLLPFVLVRRRAVVAAFALTAVAAAVLGAAEGEVRDTLRHAGWRGP